MQSSYAFHFRISFVFRTFSLISLNCSTVHHSWNCNYFALCKLYCTRTSRDILEMDAHKNGGKYETHKENGFSTILKRTRFTSLTDVETHELPGICEEWSDNLRAVLFTDTEIQSQVRKLAQQICRDYQGRSVICVGLLSGAMVFLADLLRHFTIPYKVDFLVVSSYGSATTSSGSIRLKKDLSLDPNGMDVLIIEDLIDTGNTLQWIKTHLNGKGCKSIKICCLLDKKERRTVPITADYVGFECPDEFIVGYGMDYAEDYRCLPFIGVLKPKAFMNS